ncbi:MAG: helix-turn-helix domain-containing protein [Butyrivibrio sp.]|nr:helix-turn-helix domain-containing protein [Butyrivibrio sp.]
MNPNEITGARLKKLRTDNGLNQQEFAEKFSEFVGRETVLSVMTISNWETGRKLPPADTIIWISRFYNASADYILGLSNEEVTDPKAPKDKKKITSISSQIEIPFSELSKYNGQPVFLTFPSGTMAAQWALLDYNKKLLICRDMKIALSPSIKYSITTPPELVTIQSLAHHFIGFEDMMKMEHVYVESLSPDPYLRGQISGWYHHTPNKTCLVNELGMTLSYEGIDVAYRVLDSKKSPKK